ncbi:MAG: ParB/RepB/Spo0J family partition protein [Rickettsiales bacterium]
MAQVKQSKGLGRGLSSLMGEAALVEVSPSASAQTTNEQTGQGGQDILRLPVAQLRAGKYQPRRHFDDAALNELRESIEKHGLMQPIVVRAIANNAYEIIAGERRFRAAKLAKLSQVPVIIREVTDSEALELALIENIQRADLNPLEEAAGYQRLMDEFHYTQEKLAPIVGKSRSHIANLLRLLKLPDSIKSRIDSGELTMGHARAILMSKNPEELAKQIVEIGLSVRQAEERAKGVVAKPETSMPGLQGLPKQRPSVTRRGGVEKSEDVIQLENMLSESLGLRVSIDARGGQAGEVIIGYDSLTQLDEILRRLGGGM